MSVKVTVRLNPAIIERLDALIEEVSQRTGMAATRSDVVREAMMAGLRTMESPRPRRVKPRDSFESAKLTTGEFNEP